MRYFPLKLLYKVPITDEIIIEKSEENSPELNEKGKFQTNFSNKTNKFISLQSQIQCFFTKRSCEVFNFYRNYK